ncbi:late control D family protein [Escherichia coli]|nr:late control D family protein [Escherichia coli]
MHWHQSVRSCALSGKRVIDEQDWTITKVTHFLNNSGFTTSLELEVRLSDVGYETEDNE